jgi:hypothetical protein
MEKTLKKLADIRGKDKVKKSRSMQVDEGVKRR